MTEQTVKKDLAQTGRLLEDLLERAGREVAGDSAEALEHWRGVCQTCRHRLDDDLLRMAVVGTIKSGKSTFINALFSGDYLKRGAGVITSIVTRARRSDRLEAVLYFKSWEEINTEIRQALSLFPSANWRSLSAPFDIRIDSDRHELKAALTSLESKYLLTRDSRSVSSVLLASYLEGYDRSAAIVSDRMETRVHSGAHFYEHQEFAGNQELAVYLKDLELFINSGDLAENIEIADCQGSDSPNPMHLAMIQDYLHASDLIVYLISSRTGIRQADIKFMSMIKQMGAMGNVLFVVNCDFNEHENLDDLQRVADKVRQDLALLVLSPAVYTFSSLYALFADMPEALPEKDRARLSQWRREASLADFSQKERARFESDFKHLITEHRYQLLLKNQLQRLTAVAGDFHQWLTFNRKILSSNADGAGALIKQIRQQQKKTEKIRTMINSTFDGTCQQLKKEIKTVADRFFDIRHGQVVPLVVDFIRSYHIAADTYRNMLLENGFSETLLVVFQDFKEKTDRYMAEEINPRMFGFVGENEAYILEHLRSICRPYETMIPETLAEFHANGASGAGSAVGDNAAQSAPVSIDWVKKAHDIRLPDASAALDYTRGIQTEAFMKLGLFRFVQGLKKLVKRADANGSPDFSALESGVAKMKRETEAAVVFHFKNYRENLKFQYMFRLIDSLAGEMNQWLVQRFQAYDTDLTRIREMTNTSQTEKQQALELTERLISDLEQAEAQIRRLQHSLEVESSPGNGLNSGRPDQ